MALAERMDLARTVGRGTLLVLRLDPDPRVLVAVLDNRFAIEADVVQAAIQPDATAEILSPDRGASPLGSCGRPCAAPCCATLSCPRPSPCPF